MDFGAIQEQRSITRERINEMLTWRPRRMKLSQEWPDALHAPKGSYKDWSLVLPFCETFKNAFESMCLVKSTGLRPSRDARCCAFLPDAKTREATLDSVREFLKTVDSYVALRDCLALSFALDYDSVDGNPNNPQTPIGKLRSRAKPYQRGTTNDTYVAADEIVSNCLEFLGKMTCYGDATCIMAIPPSDPSKPFNLPRYLASEIARELNVPDRSPGVQTIKARESLRTTPVSNKLNTIEGTISVDSVAVRDENVLLIDDLYQSGVSMNYTAMLLIEAGANRVYGLACEKTCTNDDNIR